MLRGRGGEVRELRVSFSPVPLVCSRDPLVGAIRPFLTQRAELSHFPLGFKSDRHHGLCQQLETVAVDACFEIDRVKRQSRFWQRRCPHLSLESSMGTLAVSPVGSFGLSMLAFGEVWHVTRSSAVPGCQLVVGLVVCMLHAFNAHSLFHQTF